MTTIDLIFHVGRSKTATSFLQKYAAQLPDTLFVGKDEVGLACGFLSEEVRVAHYDVFPSYRIERANYANPSRNSYFAVERYAALIGEAWVRQSQAVERPIERIIVSDECISDYANYLGEFNIALVKALSAAVEEKVGGHFAAAFGGQSCRFSPVLSVSVREQVDLLQSFYGYSYPSLCQRFGSFSAFVQWVLAYPHLSVQGGCFYGEAILLYERILGDGFVIKAVPYELLSQGGTEGGRQFFTEVFSGTVGLPEELLGNIDAGVRVNANSAEGVGGISFA